MIAIIGKPGVGKTHFLRNLKKSGFAILILDELVVQIYTKNNQGYEIIKNEFGEKFVDSNSVLKDKLRTHILKNNLLARLSSLIHPLVGQILEQKKWDFVEIADLYSKHYNFVALFSLVVEIRRKEDNRQKLLLLREISKNKVTELNSLYHNIKNKSHIFVYTLTNVSWKDYAKIGHDLVNKSNKQIKKNKLK